MKLETTNVTPILQCAITLKDLTSVSACRVFPKVDMNINVQVNIPPSTSRYQLKWILLKCLLLLSNLFGVNQVEMMKASSKWERLRHIM